MSKSNTWENDLLLLYFNNTNAAGTSAVDGFAEMVARVSSGIHRLQNIRARPYVPVDWNQGFEAAKSPESQALSEVDREIQTLMRVALAKATDVHTDAAKIPSEPLNEVLSETLRNRRKRQALILLLMAA